MTNPTPSRNGTTRTFRRDRDYEEDDSFAAWLADARTWHSLKSRSFRTQHRFLDQHIPLEEAAFLVVLIDLAHRRMKANNQGWFFVLRNVWERHLPLMTEATRRRLVEALSGRKRDRRGKKAKTVVEDTDPWIESLPTEDLAEKLPHINPRPQRWYKINYPRLLRTRREYEAKMADGRQAYRDNVMGEQA